MSRMAAPIRPNPTEPASGLVPMTLEQFLEWEERQERRYEFVDGYVRAMTGSTIRHSLIVGNVYRALWPAAARVGCAAHAGDVQVRTPAGKVYYPDVVLRCGPFGMGERHARTPCLIVEVTSPSTRPVDYGTKKKEYFTVASLRGYIIVEQAVRRIEGYVRQDDGVWSHVEVSDSTGVLEFAPPCVDAVLTLAELYAGTDILPPPPDLDPEPLPRDG